MQQTSYEIIENSVFLKTTSFKDRLERISVQPIENEAAVRAVKAATDQLITDMQAFSNSLILEGPRSGIYFSGPVLGTDFAIIESASA
jgi:hypothetical protein